MRKILGTTRLNLVLQFITESVLYSLFAFFVAIALIYAIIPFFNDFVAKNITDPFFGRLFLFPYVLAGSIVVGIMAGVYPAFFMTSFNPVKVMKGELANGVNTSLLRNFLVVIQFIISLVLIIGTGVVYKQLRYSQNKSLGYDKDKVIIIKNTSEAGINQKTLKDDLLKLTDVSFVTTSSFTPSGSNRSDLPFAPEGLSGLESAVASQVWKVDHDYLNTMGINIIEGRDFDVHLASDSNKIIINQTMVNRLGFTDPVGKVIKPVVKFEQFKHSRFEIIGVVQDFHFDSFKDDIFPLIFHLDGTGANTAVRYSGKNPAKMIDNIMGIWEIHSGGRPFEYVFLDQEFNSKFKNEKRLGTIFGTFAFLAICIACLGLFGLASFTAEQRRKEIGIRKVLGATIMSIVSLLFTTFTKLLIISFVISTPIAYFIMNSWLQEFKYRTSVSFDIILLSCAVVFVLAWSTVSYQSFRAARIDPAKNLKYE